MRMEMWMMWAGVASETGMRMMAKGRMWRCMWRGMGSMWGTDKAIVWNGGYHSGS